MAGHAKFKSMPKISTIRGIKEWHDDRYELVDVVVEAQDRFKAQIELQKLYAHSRLYLPADYTED
jgi:hypothetical protein